MDTAQTNAEFAQCSEMKIKEADARMTAAWRKLFADEGGTKTTRGKALLSEQRAWIAFRQIACSEYLGPDSGREEQVLHGPMCIANIISARAQDLESRYQLNHQDQINP